MSITPDEMVSPEAYRAVCEERDDLAARVHEFEVLISRAPEEMEALTHYIAEVFEVGADAAYEYAAKTERELEAQNEGLRDALAIIEGLEAQVAELEAEVVKLRGRLLALRHRDLLGRAAGREHVGPLHLERWAELESAGWVVREGAVFVLTPEGEEVWRG